MELWKHGRVVEGTRLESEQTVKGFRGSNPLASDREISINRQGNNIDD